MTITAAIVLAAALGLQPVAPAQPAKPDVSTPEAPKVEKPAATKSADSPFMSDKAEEIAKGYGFTEGPTWVPGKKDAAGKQAAGFFIFCDMGNDKVYRYDNSADKPVALRDPAARAIGSTSDADGTIYNVDTETRAITSWSVGADGKPSAIRTLADKIGGEQLGGMNDIAVTKDGTLYVTHADWFLPPRTKVPFIGLLRIAKDGSTHKAAENIERPNGVTLSPDGKTLYVTEFSKGVINAFDIGADGALTNRRSFADLKAMAKEQGITKGGGVDGIRCDSKGNVFSTGPGGIWAVAPDGKFLGHLAQSGTNIAFGGADGKTLLITTGKGVMKVAVKNPGAGW